MRVSLRDSDEFQLQSSLTRTRTVCVCGGDSDTLNYLVTPLKIGKINIQAEVRTRIHLSSSLQIRISKQQCLTLIWNWINFKVSISDDLVYWTLNIELAYEDFLNCGDLCDSKYFQTNGICLVNFLIKCFQKLTNFRN